MRETQCGKRASGGQTDPSTREVPWQDGESVVPLGTDSYTREAR